MEYAVWIGMVLVCVVMGTILALAKKHGKSVDGIYAGQSGIVTADIANDKSAGVVKVAGKSWSAVSENGLEIPKNSKVIVKKVSGDVLVVEVVRFTAFVGE